MKRFLIFILATLLFAMPLLGLWPLNVKAAPYVFIGGGDGVLTPYVVLTPEDMNHVRDQLDKKYILGADIDLSAYAAGLGWEPVGIDIAPFTGKFDGNDNIISGLVINSTQQYVGLFGYTQGAEIKNLNLENIHITGGIVFVGGVAGMARSTLLSNIYVSGSIISSTGSGTGGLAGILSETGSKILNSYAAVNVTSSSSLGGLVGSVDLGTNGIENSYSSGIITGGSRFGGLMSSSYGPILNSYSISDLVATGSGLIGGLASMQQNTLVSSYAAGTINGSTLKGALLGEHRPAYGAIVNSYWNTTSYPTLPGVFQGGVGGDLGLTDIEMRTASAYPGFDFTNIWGIDEGHSYPYLRVFAPVVRADTLVQTKYKANSVLTVNAHIRDGSIGEEVAVNYETFNSSNSSIESVTHTVTATGDYQNDSIHIILNSNDYPEGSYTMKITPLDNARNSTAARTVNFIVDSTPPVIVLNGSDSMTIEQGTSYNEPGATALDAVDGNLNSNIAVSGSVNTSLLGLYTITYQVSDAAGNVATKIRTINVIAPPVQHSGDQAQPGPTRSNNADLAKLAVDAVGEKLRLTPEFTSKTMDYSGETTAEHILIQTAPSDPKAVVKLLDEAADDAKSIPLNIGMNVFNIIVQAEDGTLKTYTVKINRNPVDPPLVPLCTFKDIEKHWAKKEICEAAELGIVEGAGANIFVPDGHITRTEFAVMLLRTLHVPINESSAPLSFSDTESIPAWALPAIQTALAKGVISGYLDGTFRSQQIINRIEMAAMITKAMKWEKSSKPQIPFTDDARIPAWAKFYVEAIQEQGLIQGREGNQFVPYGITTRAEATVILLRLWKSLYGSTVSSGGLTIRELN